MSVNTFKKELWEEAIIESFKGVSVAELITRKQIGRASCRERV